MSINNFIIIILFKCTNNQIIVNFTHILETLLDKAREGEVNLTQNEVDLLLKSTDVTKQLIDAAEKGEKLGLEFCQDICQQLEKFAGISGANGGSNSNDASNDDNDNAP